MGSTTEPSYELLLRHLTQTLNAIRNLTADCLLDAEEARRGMRWLSSGG